MVDSAHDQRQTSSEARYDVPTVRKDVAIRTRHVAAARRNGRTETNGAIAEPPPFILGNCHALGLCFCHLFKERVVRIHLSIPVQGRGNLAKCLRGQRALFPF